MVTRKKMKNDSSTGKNGKLVVPPRTKKEARSLLLISCPWVIRPDEIHKQAMRLMRKECTLVFAKQFGEVLRLSYHITNLRDQQTAMNPGLRKAQRDGSIKKEIWTTLDALGEAWKQLIILP